MLLVNSSLVSLLFVIFLCFGERGEVTSRSFLLARCNFVLEVCKVGEFVDCVTGHFSDSMPMSSYASYELCPCMTLFLIPRKRMHRNAK